MRLHPRRALEELPDGFPVFPLAGALLLPRGRLPLNIFEPRYLAMTEDALAAGRMFGMIQPEPHRPRSPGGPGAVPRRLPRPRLRRSARPMTGAT